MKSTGLAHLRQYDEVVTDGAVDSYLNALAGTARSVLGAQFFGAYAAGSVALGAFDPERSDVDVALLCRDPLSKAVKQELIESLRHNVLPCPARGLELVVYTVATAQPGTAQPGFELELNDGPAMDFQQSVHPAERPAADGLFWYGLDRSLLHQSRRSPENLRGLLIASLQWWMALSDPDNDHSAAGSEDAVLGTCRALVWHRYGRWLSKINAGNRLVMAGYRPAEVIAQAIAARSGGPSTTSWLRPE